MTTTLVLLSIAILSCSSHRIAPLSLPMEEPPIILAALTDEVSSIEEYVSERPIVFLDLTKEWYGDTNRPEIPAGLPQANKRRYSLETLKLPAGISIYSALEFEDTYKFAKPSKSIVKQFGAEPIILSVSRPVITPDGIAHLLLYNLSTWSGCGGVDIVHLTRDESEWVVERRDLLAFW